jgi:predicted transposase/invertase (TIGR01784 family)
MAYDKICKRLAELYPQSFASWLLGQPVVEAEILKTELSNDPIHVDSLILLKPLDSILHIEFQTTPQSRPPLPLRMLDYWVRLYRKHELPVQQFVLVLEQTPGEIPAEFRAPNTWHRYTVIKLWQEEFKWPEEHIGLLPLALLMRSDDPKLSLVRIAERLMKVEPPSLRSELITCAHVLAGLRFDKELIKALFPEEIMQESVTYQEIIQKGIQRGLLEGKLEGKLEMVLRLLKHRYGQLEPGALAQIEKLNASALDDLSEAVLDFKDESGFERWLAEHA